MTEATLNIGEVARRAGVNRSAIRFYERRGLLPEPERATGRRVYTEAAVDRLAMIGAAKRAGLSLAEIGALLRAAEEGAPAHEGVRALAERKLPQVEEQIQRAEATRSWLLAASGCGCESLDACALFAACSQ